MAQQHRANPSSWDQIDSYAKTDLNDDYAICLLELRDRVVALEGNAKPTSNNLPISSSGDHPLVMRVAQAIHPSMCADINLYLDEARRAINEIAVWLREEHGWSVGPALLEMTTADNPERSAE